MEIKLTISLDERTHEVLNRLIAAIGGTSAVVQPEIAGKPAVKPVATAKAKVEEVGEAKPAKPSAVSDSVSATKAEKAKPKVTIEDLRALAADVKVKQGSTEGVKKLLNAYGAKNISSLPEDKMDAFADELKEML